MCLHCVGMAFVKSVAISTPIWIVYIGLKVKYLDWKEKRNK